MRKGLKTLVLFVGLVGAVALVLGQSPPPPVNLRLGLAPAVPTDTNIIAVPVVRVTSGNFQAWYTGQPSGVWMPESSTNGGVTWERCTTEWAEMPSRAERALSPKSSQLPKMTEIATNSVPSWMVRLRRLSPTAFTPQSSPLVRPPLYPDPPTLNNSGP